MDLLSDKNKQGGLRMRPKALQPIHVAPPLQKPTPDGGGDAVVVDEEQPLSPAARLFHEPLTNCCIIAIMGMKTKLDVDVIKDGLMNSLVKHPRFSSKLVMDGKPKWVRTEVDIENHVILPDLDPNMRSPDQFVEDYISNLTTIPLDFSKPLWEVHILNTSVSDASAVVVLRIHHSLGDGVSLISLLLACARKTSDPEALPSLPLNRKKARFSSTNGFWRVIAVLLLVLKLVWNTCVHMMLFVATMLFLRDTKTPIKGDPGNEKSPRRIVHRMVSLDDIRLVKREMNVTINDVILGVTQAGLSRYLNRKHSSDKEGNEASVNKDYLPKKIRLRACVLVNIRPSSGIQDLADMMSKKSKCRWGNAIGYIILPFHIALLKDPLDHIREAKATADRKKLSLESKLTYYSGKLIMRIFGTKAIAALVYRVFCNSTMSFSNVVGPAEDVSFYGHPIAYIAPTVYGHPHALTVHFQSHGNKMTIVVSVDEGVIPDPRGFCDDLEESLLLMKNAVVARKLADTGGE